MRPRRRGQPGVAEAVDADGDEDGVAAVGDHAGAFVDLHQGAGGGDAAFGEDDQAGAGAGGLHHGLGAVGVHGVDGEDADGGEEGLGPPLAGGVDVDGEGAGAGEEGGDEGAVVEALVVDDQDGAAVRGRHVLGAADGDAVKDVEVGAEDGLHGGLGQQAHDPEGDEEVEGGQQQQDGGGRHARDRQQRGDDGGGDHGDGV